MISLTLSIVIPAYNEEDYLKKCLDSIAAQTVAPEAVYVVDNNSTDKTAAIAQSYPFVTLLKEKRQGIVPARDKGFNSVKTDLIGRIDADTILPSTWVAQALAFMKDNESALTGGCYIYDLGMPRFAGWMQNQLAFRANRLILGYYITWGSNLVFPTKWWHDVKDEVCHDPFIHEDLDLGIHLHRHGYEVTYKTSFKVGIASRFFLHRRKGFTRQLNYMKMWPRTLKSHHLKHYGLAYLGTYIVYTSYWMVRPLNWLGWKLQALHKLKRG